MFSLSPIPPTGTPSRVAAPTVDDWCGTRIPTTPPSVQPVPPIDGAPLARTLAHVTEGYRALLDAHGALNPMVPMIFEPGQRPVAPDFMTAIASAERGIAAIDQAIGSYGLVRDEVATALESAATDARRGYQSLIEEHRLDVLPDVTRISMQFDSAATWLDVAGNLLALRLGRSGFEPFAQA